MVNHNIKNKEWTNTRLKPELILFVELVLTNLSIILGMLTLALCPIAGLHRNHPVSARLDNAIPHPAIQHYLYGLRKTQRMNVPAAGTYDTHQLAANTAGNDLTTTTGRVSARED